MPRTTGLLCACLLAGGAAAQREPTAPTFVGNTVEQWLRRLADDREATIVLLANGPPASLDMLRALLVQPDQEVVGSAARACLAMGPAAAPLTPELLDHLRASDSWWTQLHCADALAAIGAKAPPVLHALMAQLCHSPVPHLRQVCAQALSRLDADVARRVVGAVRAHEFADTAYAVEALVDLGEPVVEGLIRELSSEGEPGEVVHRALTGIGWRAAAHLERAGHAKLALEALHTGPLRWVTFGDGFEVASTDPAMPPQLPAIEWVHGSGHGGDLDLFRGAEAERGFAIEWIRLSRPDRKDSAPAVEVASTTIPRERAHALSRQLVVLGGMTLQPRDGVGQRSLGSSNDFAAQVLLRFGADIGLRESFAGYATEDNTPARFRAQAAIGVLNEAMQGAVWTPRQPTAADRDQVDSLRMISNRWWVAERLRLMRDLLRVK